MSCHHCRRRHVAIVVMIASFCGVQLNAHIDAAAAVGKPLLLGEFNKLPPVSDRNAFVDMVLSTLQQAIAAGKPLAGVTGPINTALDSLGACFDDFDKLRTVLGPKCLWRHAWC